MPVDKFGNEIRQSGATVKSDEGISLSFANNTYIRLDGENDITGNLNMALRKIENLGEPTNPKDATSKEYVDNTKGTGVISVVKDETATLKGNLNFGELYRIKNLPDPIDEKDAAHREYVDLKGESLKTELLTSDAFEFKNNEYQAKQNLNMDGTFTVKNLMDPVDEKDGVNRKYVDENTAFIFRNNEYYAKGDIFLRNAKLGGLPQPTQDGDAVTKKYVDDSVTGHFVDENDNIVFGRDVDMEGNQILGLPQPATDQEPATKKYVDDSQIYELDKRGNIKFDRNINHDRRLILTKEPKRDNDGTNKKYVDETIDKRIQEEKDNFLPKDPATKEYVDEAIRGIAGGDVLVSKEGVFIKENGHYRATAPLDIDNQKMENIPNPVDETDAANKKYVDDVAKSLTLEEALVRENGGYNIADAYINMNFNHIKNLAYPKNEADAVTRKFVQDVIRNVETKVLEIQKESPFLKENGNYKALTSIDMSYNQLLNLRKPTESYDAVTKDYVDYVENKIKEKFEKEIKEKLEKEIKEKVEKKTHVIAANASYHGDLTKTFYHFNWGARREPERTHVSNLFEGFMFPSSGYIKKFVFFSTGIKINGPKNKSEDELMNEIGLNKPFPVFTIDVMKYNQVYFHLGKIYFFFKEIGPRYDDWYMDYVFKFENGYDENTRFNTKDIINIRSEIDTKHVGENRFHFRSTPYLASIDDEDFHVYNVTLLIEIDD